jgi:hypothetical protein
MVEKHHLSDEADPPQSGNLFEPLPGAVRGGWRRGQLGSRVGTALVAALPVALGVGWWRSHRGAHA